MTRRDDPRILVVDDDPDICRNLSDILTDLGYAVDFAQDGSAALELVRRRPYDVALLDLKMPGMDGLTLYREIKKQRAATVSLLVTAYAGPATANEARSAGAWKVVPKPVDFPTLLGLVDEALGQPLVLVVDDDRDLCANLWDLLREGGFRVGIAHDRREAADTLKASRFKVVLIDMKIPDGDGDTVFRMVREANPQARTILITGYRPQMDQLVAQVLAEGADTVCYKPFDVPQPAIKVLVHDNGPGLDPELRQKVFDPFFTTKAKGTGLGMAIARRIVEAHGGQIAVADGNGGGAAPGAVFVITLPRGNS